METHATEDALADQLVGDSPCMQRLRREVRQLAARDVNLLLQGETGTGKELVARAVHTLGARSSSPFVGVNCAAIHESLLESELFGHAAGAFTGARWASVGFLRAASGGTILLDEVGDMSESLQSKLLRVLEERTVVPVGETRGIPIDVRVISATHCCLAQAVRGGSFRRDLYYRLNVVCLSIPPLRERPGDIPLLAEHMVKRIAAVLEMPVKTISPDAMAAMVQYDWPGNVRELGNVIQRAYVLGQGPRIEVEDLPPDILGEPDGELVRRFPTLREALGRHIEEALTLSNGVRNRAAEMLAVDRKTLRRMIARHRLKT